MNLLLCPPDYFSIEYEINPWMSRSHNTQREVAMSQWLCLRETLEQCGAHVELMSPQAGLPDMVFTANAGLVVDDLFIPSNFYFPERQGEERFFEAWFREHGYRTSRLPKDLHFEGEGDALFCGDTLFCGYRFRSDIRSHGYLSEMLQSLVVSLELVDPRWYHLDTCFCPLPDGGAFWYPGAFEGYSQKAVRDHISNLIDVTEKEAMEFACNAVVLGRQIILPDGCPVLTEQLQARGYACHPLPMTEFLKSGGACKCLTLFLPQKHLASRESRSATAGSLVEVGSVVAES